ncbi:hypothetical protein [Acinetobacter venetianus]|uniref:GIY-YIG domain-containing protein n=1 Tax=Acinetobacter venetianus TaxID=52133 RepID=A0A150HQS4_9GAMM|nr:hypothetical protein [Acinetobacter venetianus]KXZ68559.1 hypothetical protein AVENLUH13518_03290 [Acinetobacter venetianus]
MDFFQLSGEIKSPYIYFIYIDGFLYVGETQSFPAIRWGAHLTNEGTLLKKLVSLGGDLGKKNQRIKFISFNLIDLFDLNLCKNFKRSTQAIEHELHVRIKCKPSIVNNLTLISDTEKTAPSRFKYWDQVNLIVDHIIEKL